jgi:glucokinase
MWAVAVPGPFDYLQGRGSFQGVGKFDALSGVDLRAELARGLGVPPSAVSFVNDATAYGIGEWAFGAARGHRRAICLTLGTGIGSVFLIDGIAVDQGQNVPPEGHMHLQSFRGRPLEEFVSSRAMEAHYRALTARESSVKQIFARARSGEVQALEVIDAGMSVLGASVGPWSEAFGASAIVIGGSISRGWDVLEAPLRRGLASHSASVARDVLLAPACLLDDAPLLGAAAWLSRLL